MSYLAGSPAAASFIISRVPLRCFRAFRAKLSTESIVDDVTDFDCANAGDEAKTE